MEISLASYILGFFQTACLLVLQHAFASGHDLLWPSGQYALPKAKTGCPSSTGFTWQTGYIFQDTEDNGENKQSSKFHLKAHVNKDVKRDFCVKVNSTPDKKRKAWPKGKYCIYMRGPTCPTSFTEGWAKWDDENTENRNKNSGLLPSGEYLQDTRINYCCRSDGDTNSPVDLPAQKEFYLLAYLSAECQKVKWAVHHIEFITYAVEKQLTKHDGKVPYGIDFKNRTEHYCHYQSCNHTLTSRHGTLTSPNYPSHYPHGQHCSWRIVVDSYEQITIKFDEFKVENSIECAADAVTVFDGDNQSAPVLGQFCGGIVPPLNGISSSGHELLVIFKSDGKNSLTGFKASYTSTAVRPSPPPTTVPPTEELSTIKEITAVTFSEISLQVETSEDNDSSDDEGFPVWVPIVIGAATVILMMIVLVIVLIIYLVVNQRCQCSRHTHDARKRTISSTISDIDIQTIQQV